MADPIVNFFKSTLVGTYSNTDTSFTIATGDGALLPDPAVDGAFNLTIFEGLQVTNSTTFEIVRVTAKSGDVLTVTRGQEGTSALTIGSATHSILMSATKKTFDDLNTAIANVDLTSLTSVEELSFDTTGNEILRFPLGTSAQRPTSPQTGYVRYNTDTSSIEFYNGTNWLRLQAVEFNSLSLGVASATVSGNDATLLVNVIENAERLVFDTSGNEEFGLPSGTEAQRPTASNGYMRYNTDSSVIEVYQAGEWVQLDTSAYPALTFYGNRGLFGGGTTGSVINVIDYVAIDTTGNAQDFGDLSIAKERGTGFSGGGRGVFGGGRNTSLDETNVIDYVTISTTGNATDFGDLTVARHGLSGLSDNIYGVFGGGYNGSAHTNILDYITIDTAGNATDFGDMILATTGAGACSDGSRGVFAGGQGGGANYNKIEYITIATPSNGTDFGDLNSATEGKGGCSDGSRGLFGGGWAPINVIEYITIATTGNASDFGDLTVARGFTGSCANDTRGIFGGGESSGGNVNTIDYVTIQTTGNATDFGDLSATKRLMGSCSGD